MSVTGTTTALHRFDSRQVLGRGTSTSRLVPVSPQKCYVMSAIGASYCIMGYHNQVHCFDKPLVALTMSVTSSGKRYLHVLSVDDETR
jgi:hypothetical protein